MEGMKSGEADDDVCEMERLRDAQTDIKWKKMGGRNERREDEE